MPPIGPRFISYFLWISSSLEISGIDGFSFHTVQPKILILQLQIKL